MRAIEVQWEILILSLSKDEDLGHGLGRAGRPPWIIRTAKSAAPSTSIGRRYSILSPTSRAMAMQAAAK